MHTFLLIDDFAGERPLLLPKTVFDQSDVEQPAHQNPDLFLQHFGYAVYTTSLHDAAFLLARADAVILATPLSNLRPYTETLQCTRHIPTFYWRDEDVVQEDGSLSHLPVDGFLSGSMSKDDLYCALMIAFTHFHQKNAWLKEREEMQSRLEERKWIEQAKRILGEVKHLTESEAYDFLRKQAMNERKKIIDVATSIVNVYQLIQETKKARTLK